MTNKISLNPSFLSTQPEAAGKKATISSDLLYEGKTIRLMIPEHAFGRGAITVEQTGNATTFTNWQGQENKEAFELMRMTTQIWRKRHINDYLIYGKKSEINPKFEWQIVPFPPNTWKTWNLFKAFWHISFGTGVKDKQPIPTDAMNGALEKEVFLSSNLACDPQVIENQRVFEGKTINILYDHAPLAIGKEKIHFLFVPKRNCNEFSDLTEEEYLEITRASQLLVKHYAREGYPTAHLFNKNGLDTSQTIPYWHQHLVFTTNRMEGLYSQCSLLTKLNIGARALPTKELQRRVTAFKWVLSNLLD